MNENRFNLIDEPWIPVAGKGLVSLRQIFTDNDITALGGNPVEKIAVFKLLLAIAQSASTPADEKEWKELGVSGLQKAVLSYLDSQYDNFWLYGDRPFLQMPAIKDQVEKISIANPDKAIPRKIGSGSFPDLFPDNNTMVSEYDIRDISSDTATKVLFLITVQNFAFYGKQINKYISFADNYSKSVIAKPGPSIGFNNYLHTFGLTESLLESIYMNIITHEKLNEIKILGNTIGRPFWEPSCMPKTENCAIALNSKDTLLGHLVPLSRFILFSDDKIFFTEGIVYHYSKSEKKKNFAGVDWIEQSFTWKTNDNDISAIYSDVQKRPWRSLTSLLSISRHDNVFNNFALKIFFERIKAKSSFTIWSGGLDVSGDAFGKKVKGTDDFVESEIKLSSLIFSEDGNANFFDNLTNEMQELEKNASRLQRSVENYFLDLTGTPNEKAKKKDRERIKQSNVASNLYWQLCENRFQKLVTACEEPSGENAMSMRSFFYGFVLQVYDRLCPNQTARQMESWVKNRPFNSLNKKTEEVVK